MPPGAGTEGCRVCVCVRERERESMTVLLKNYICIYFPRLSLKTPADYIRRSRGPFQLESRSADTPENRPASPLSCCNSDTAKPRLDASWYGSAV